MTLPGAGAVDFSDGSISTPQWPGVRFGRGLRTGRTCTGVPREPERSSRSRRKHRGGRPFKQALARGTQRPGRLEL